VGTQERRSSLSSAAALTTGGFSRVLVSIAVEFQREDGEGTVLAAKVVSFKGVLFIMDSCQWKSASRTLVVAFPLLLAGCLFRTASPALEEEDRSSEAPVAKERLKEMTPEIRDAVKANDDFAFALYARLAQTNAGGNLFFSPYSMSSALALVAEGARGETAEEMGKTLRYPDGMRHKGEEARTLPWDMARLHTGLAALNDHFESGNRTAPVAVRDKLSALRRELKAADEQTAKQSRGGRFNESQTSTANAQRIAGDINKLQSQYDWYELRIANALWGEKTYPFRQAYLDTLEKYYHTGGYFPVDFKNDFEASRQRINAWVEDKTHRRITELIPKGAFDATLILTNAVYFKGQWAEIFPSEATKDDDFLLSGGKKVRVPMMALRNREAARYAAFQGDGSVFDTPQRIAIGENDEKNLYPDRHGFQMLELPYKGGGMSMVLFVPRSADGLAELEKKLSGADVRKWIAKMEKREVHVFVPRFKLETKYDMVDALKNMGMVRAFVDPRQANGAQFDGMSASSDPAKKLYISQVLHKAFVEVNENGTEAAAATAVSVVASAAPPITVPFTPVFKADRPFVFLIRDATSGAILFVGRMTNPK
jgi:serpin B